MCPSKVGDVIFFPDDGEWVRCQKGHDYHLQFLRFGYNNPMDFFEDLEKACPDCAREKARAKRAKQAYQDYRANHKRGRLRG